MIRELKTGETINVSCPFDAPVPSENFSLMKIYTGDGTSYAFYGAAAPTE